MSKQKVSFWIEEGEVELLKVKFNTDNLSEAIRLAIIQSLATKDLEKVKTLFPYIGKKPLRIGREVVEAFKQSGCKIFVDFFCGSIAMLCYLPWDVKTVVNDINGNLTNLYTVIRDRPSDFVGEVMKLPYSEAVFQKCNVKAWYGVPNASSGKCFLKSGNKNVLLLCVQISIMRLIKGNTTILEGVLCYGNKNN